MSTVTDLDNGAISFAERVLTLLNQGRFVSTYKYAVLLSLMDLVLEQSTKNGLPPTTVTTRQLAEKVIQVYWPHTNPFPFEAIQAQVLLQNAGAKGAQAALINLISQFRHTSKAGALAPYYMARLGSPKEYKALLNQVEWKLIEMPLPKLQRIGSSVREFIYAINWDDSITRGEVSAYQGGRDCNFDNRILLQGSTAEYLVRLNGLLRPLIQREWSTKVAQLNKLPESQLQNFLFNSHRAPAASLCGPLMEMQDGRCFYCDETIGNALTKKPEVDHFIPWSRYPDDSITNLVIAHRQCNQDKRDFLAANNHVVKWMGRFNNPGLMKDMEGIADKKSWKFGGSSNFGVASAIYTHLQPEVELWKLGKEFEVIDHKIIGMLFS